MLEGETKIDEIERLIRRYEGNIAEDIKHINRTRDNILRCERELEHLQKELDKAKTTPKELGFA